MTRFRAILPGLLLALGGCNSASPESGQNDFQTGTTPDALLIPATPVTTTGIITGRGSKGPLIGSTVDLFGIDRQGYPVSDTPVASTITDAQGNWQVAIDNSQQDLLVRISGGRYVDESDTNVSSRREIVLADSDYILSLLPAGEQSVAVTVLSHALVEKSRRETSLVPGQDSFMNVLAANRALYLSAIGFDVMAVLPSDPLNPQGIATENAYAMGIGGVANAINSLAIAMQDAIPDYTHIRHVINDLVDCQLDGLGVGEQSTLPAGLAIPNRATLNEQILRFRNNNFALYQGQTITSVNPMPCKQIGGLRDLNPPLITRIASLPAVAAESAAGVIVSNALRQQALTQFEASDDRVGEFVWQLGLPAQLALGSNVLTATVTDNWGNQAQTTWAVQVTDQTPPILQTVLPVFANAQGDLTAVNLSAPTVVDNVSTTANITLTNNAPDDGFTLGETLVTWQATDEAGLSSSITQAVFISSLAPELASVPVTVVYNGVSVDFSVYFVDPDQTTLSYAISGLSDATGLSFDAMTGLLSGTPSASDLANAPITVTVTATDTQNSVQMTTQLDLSAINTAPVFSLTRQQLDLEEDFGSAEILVVPAQVPVHEQNQMVTYTVAVVSGLSELITFAIDAVSGALTLQSVSDANGEVTLRVTANDGQALNATHSSNVFIRVNSINDAPQISANLVIPELFTGVAFSIDLAVGFSDVDDAVLGFDSSQLPASMSLSVDGVLSGVPQPVDAKAISLPVNIRATDSFDAEASQPIVITVLNPDSDGDGLTDFEEQASGSDPALTDTDGDGYGDSLEALIDIDNADTVVFYVSRSGDDSADGATPQTAVASLAALEVPVNAINAGQRVVVLIENADTAFVGGAAFAPLAADLFIAGSVDFGDLQLRPLRGDVPATRIQSETGRALIFSGCQSCTVAYVTVQNSRGGIEAIDSVLALNNVQMINNHALNRGGAVRAINSSVMMSNVHMGGNASNLEGGALYGLGTSVISISNSIFNGNYAKVRAGMMALEGALVSFDNVLISGQGAPRVSLVWMSNAASFSMRNSTVAYNYVIYSDSSLFASDTDTEIQVTDSLILFNADARGVTQQWFSGAGSLSVTGGYNGVDAGTSIFATDIEISDGASFAANYGVAGALSGALDSGSGAATAFALNNLFSAAGSVFPDSGQVDRGFHQQDPLTAPDGVQISAIYYRGAGYAHGEQVVDLFVDAQTTALGAGHRVRVSIVSADDKVRIMSASNLNPDEFETSRLAVDLGNGWYRVWISGPHRLNRDVLGVRVDDDPTTYLVTPVCSLGTCAADPLDDSKFEEMNPAAISHELAISAQ